MDRQISQACPPSHHLKGGPKPRHGMSGFTVRQTMRGIVASRQGMNGLTAHQKGGTRTARQTMSGLLAHRAMNGLVAHQKTKAPTARQDMSGLAAHQQKMSRSSLPLVKGRILHPSIMNIMVRHRRRPRLERKHHLGRQKARSLPSRLGDGRDAEWAKWDQEDIVHLR